MEHLISNPRIIIFSIVIIGLVSYKYLNPKHEKQRVNDEIKNILEFKQYNERVINKLIEDINTIENEDISNIEKIVQLQIDIRKQIDNFRLFLPINEDLLLNKWDTLAKRIINDIRNIVKNRLSL